MEAGQAAVGADPLTATVVSITGRADGRLTLLDCARAFAGFRSSRVLVAFFVAILAARIAVGGWSRLDLAIAALLIASQPFAEWPIHVFSRTRNRASWGRSRSTFQPHARTAGTTKTRRCWRRRVLAQTTAPCRSPRP
jgi:hypothetical protein